MLRSRLVRAASAALLAVPLTSAQGPAKVTTERVTRRVFAPTTMVLGEVEAVRDVEVSTETEGLVEELVAAEGAHVDAGTVLLRLRTVSREIRKRAAEAQLETARQQLAEYRRGSRPDEIRAAEAAAAEAKALVAEAETELERQQGLLDSELGSRKALAAARALAHSRAAILRQREAELALARQGPRAEVIARAEAQVALRQAELDEIRDEIVQGRIRAPFHGVLAEKLTEAGAYLRRGDPVFRLVQLDPIRVAVSVPEWLVGRMHGGAKLEIVLDAFPGRTFEGKVDAIIPAADRMARTFPVKMLLPNAERHIMPGMVARARIPTAQGAEALAVPRDAVVRGPAGAVVYKVARGTVQPVPVTLGASAGTLVQIEVAPGGALEAGDVVVVRGNEGLRPGQEIIVVKEEGRPGKGPK